MTTPSRFREPTLLSPALRASLVGSAVLGVLMGILGYFSPGEDAAVDPSNTRDVIFAISFGLVAIAYAVCLFFAVVLFPAYTYRANANLRALGVSSLTTTPGLAAGCWFIPLANLYLPYRVMVELDTASHPESGGIATNAIGAWWGCWVVGNLLSRGSQHGSSFGHALAIVSAGFLLPAGLLAVSIIRRIDEGQRTLAAGATSTSSDALVATFE